MTGDEPLWDVGRKVRRIDGTRLSTRTRPAYPMGRVVYLVMFTFRQLSVKTIPQSTVTELFTRRFWQKPNFFAFACLNLGSCMGMGHTLKASGQPVGIV